MAAADLIECKYVYCPMKFNSEEEMEQHCAQAFSCDFCIKGRYQDEDLLTLVHFPSEEELFFHTYKRHLTRFIEPKSYTCQLCGNKYSNINVHLKSKIHNIPAENHRENYIHDPPKKCPQCPREFTSNTCFFNHLKHHKPKNPICTNCGKEYEYIHYPDGNLREYINGSWKVGFWHPRELAFPDPKKPCVFSSGQTIWTIRQPQCYKCGALYEAVDNIRQSDEHHILDRKWKHPEIPLPEGCKRFIWNPQHA